MQHGKNGCVFRGSTYKSCVFLLRPHSGSSARKDRKGEERERERKRKRKDKEEGKETEFAWAAHPLASQRMALHRRG